MTSAPAPVTNVMGAWFGQGSDCGRGAQPDHSSRAIGRATGRQPLRGFRYSPCSSESSVHGDHCAGMVRDQFIFGLGGLGNPDGWESRSRIHVRGILAGIYHDVFQGS